MREGGGGVFAGHYGNLVCRELGFLPTGTHQLAFDCFSLQLYYFQVQLLTPLLPLVGELALFGLMMCAALALKVD